MKSSSRCEQVSSVIGTPASDAPGREGARLARPGHRGHGCRTRRRSAAWSRRFCIWSRSKRSKGKRVMSDILSKLTPPVGAVTKERRIGRGVGSGLGKTAGRGQRGQKARSKGNINKLHFQGGQTPMQRRLPKRGFRNPFRVETAALNIGELERFLPAPTSTRRPCARQARARPSRSHQDPRRRRAHQEAHHHGARLLEERSRQDRKRRAVRPSCLRRRLPET